MPRSRRRRWTGSVGDAYDKAMAEAFFATLECELLDWPRFRSQAEARNVTEGDATCPVGAYDR